MCVFVQTKKSILCALNVRRVCVSTCVFWIFLTLGIVNDENMLCTMWITCVCVYRQVVTQTHRISTFWVSAVLTLLVCVCVSRIEKEECKRVSQRVGVFFFVLQQQRDSFHVGNGKCFFVGITWIESTILV